MQDTSSEELESMTFAELRELCKRMHISSVGECLQTGARATHLRRHARKGPCTKGLPASCQVQPCFCSPQSHRQPAHDP